MRFYIGRKIGKNLLGASASGKELSKFSSALLSWIVVAIIGLAYLVISGAEWFHRLLFSTPWLRYSIAFIPIIIFHMVFGAKTEAAATSEQEVRKLFEEKKQGQAHSSFFQDYSLMWSCYSEYLKSKHTVTGLLDKPSTCLGYILAEPQYISIKVAGWLIFWIGVIYLAIKFSYSELVVFAFIPGFLMSVTKGAATTSGDSFGFFDFLLFGFIFIVVWILISLFVAYPMLALFKYLIC